MKKIIIPFLFAAAGHEKQEQHHQQVRCIEILGDKVFQESSRRTGRLRWCRFWWRRATGLRGPFLLPLLRETVFPVSTVGLGNVSIINGNHLPDSEGQRLPGPILPPAWLSPVCSAAGGAGKDLGPSAEPADWSRWKFDWTDP